MFFVLVKEKSAVVWRASGGEAVRIPWPELWSHIHGAAVPAESVQREGGCVVLSVIQKPQAGFFWLYRQSWL